MSYLYIFKMKFETIIIFQISTLECFQMRKFVQIKETSNLGLKTPYLGIFGLLIWKTVVICEISTLKFVKMSKVSCKNSNCSIWNQKCLISAFLDWSMKKILSYLKSQKFVQIKKIQIWDQQYLIWVFWTVILKNYCHMWNLISQICENSWFDAKTKALYLGPKVLVWVYLGWNFKNYCNIWNHNLRLSEIANYLAKIKKINFWAMFVCVLGCNFKKRLPYLKSALSKLLKMNF